MRDGLVRGLHYVPHVIKTVFSLLLVAHAGPFSVCQGWLASARALLGRDFSAADLETLGRVRDQVIGARTAARLSVGRVIEVGDARYEPLEYLGGGHKGQVWRVRGSDGLDYAVKEYTTRARSAFGFRVSLADQSPRAVMHDHFALLELAQRGVPTLIDGTEVVDEVRFRTRLRFVRGLSIADLLAADGLDESLRRKVERRAQAFVESLRVPALNAAWDRGDVLLDVTTGRFLVIDPP